ncbi:MAG: hypothetical protein WCO48_01225 [Candidatus Taylorbacteria bacterium]
MDNGNINNSSGNELPIHDPLKWKSLGFFSAEEYLLYVFKKVEKITAALYLVSGLLKDEEPIKWELRDKGMDLLTSSFTASSTLPGDKNTVIQSLFTAALETISLLNVAKVSSLITEMNHRLLVREIDGILGLLRDRLIANAETAGYVLSDVFFKTPNLFSTDFKSNTGSAGTQSSGHSSNQSVGQHGQLQAINKPIHKGHVDVQEKKSERQELIITALKGQSSLTIKDFTKIIKGCSEKTIQRELLAMVDNGLIKKEGERRWSRYSLR